MKHIIEFEDDDDNAQIQLHAVGYYSALWDITQHVRERIKYGELDEKTAIEMTALRGFIRDLIVDNHLPELS